MEFSFSLSKSVSLVPPHWSTLQHLWARRRVRYPVGSSGSLVASHLSLLTACILESKRQKRGQEKKKWKRTDDIRQGGEDTERRHRGKGIENATPIFHTGLLAAAHPFYLLGSEELILPLLMCMTLERLSNGIWPCVWRRVLGVWLRNSHVLGKCSLTELQPCFFFPVK